MAPRGTIAPNAPKNICFDKVLSPRSSLWLSWCLLVHQPRLRVPWLTSAIGTSNRTWRFEDAPNFWWLKRSATNVAQGVFFKESYAGIFEYRKFEEFFCLIKKEQDVCWKKELKQSSGIPSYKLIESFVSQILLGDTKFNLPSPWCFINIWVTAPSPTFIDFNKHFFSPDGGQCLTQTFKQDHLFFWTANRCSDSLTN